MHHKLFHRQACPYSKKVRDYIENHGLRQSIEYRDIGEDPIAAEELAEAVGKTQVPCLMFEGKPMLESDEIIHYLDKNFVQAGEHAHH